MAARKIIKIDEEKCDGCGLCVPNCAEGALQVVDGKARLVKETYCDGLGACLGHCPQGALSIEEREASGFDEGAALAHVQAIACDKMDNPDPARETTLPCGCPSTAVRHLRQAKTRGRKKGRGEPGESLLTNWPVQIRLVPEDAPYLKGADLLVASDCVPTAYRRFHRDLLDGRVLLVGCPKLDDADFYARKLTRLFKLNNPRSVTVARMEVPCCAGMAALVRQALQESGVRSAWRDVTVGIRGDILADAAG